MRRQFTLLRAVRVSKRWPSCSTAKGVGSGAAAHQRSAITLQHARANGCGLWPRTNGSADDAERLVDGGGTSASLRSARSRMVGALLSCRAWEAEAVRQGCDSIVRHGASCRSSVEPTSRSSACASARPSAAGPPAPELIGCCRTACEEDAGDPADSPSTKSDK